MVRIFVTGVPSFFLVTPFFVALFVVASLFSSISADTAPKQKEVKKRCKGLPPGIQNAKKQRRERVLTALAVAAGASKVSYRQGLQLFDSGNGGTYFVLFKREALRLETSQADDSTVSAAANEELGTAALGADGRPFPAWMLRKKMEEKRTAGHPIDPRVEWFAFVRFGNALDFSLTLKPNSLVPYNNNNNNNIVF